MIQTQSNAPLLLPAYRALENDTRYTLVEGGRGSAKSFHVAIWCLTLTYRPEEVILYTRYTMDSAEKSIIPEFVEKIELYGLGDMFAITKNIITNKVTGSRIIFSGIKTSSGNQTAKLKSITGLTAWVLDEAEEMPSITDFNKIDESIRKKGGSNKVMLVLNPGFKSHWIYRHFHMSGRRSDTTYIHTTYRDNRANLDQSFLSKAEALRRDDKQEYLHRYLGQWQDVHKGIIFPSYEAVDSMPEGYYIYGLDFGYVDPMALVRVLIADPYVYIEELSYRQYQTVPDLIGSLPGLGVGFDAQIYYDSANPGDGQQIADAGYRRAKPAVKGANSIASGIGAMKRYNLRIVKPSDYLIEELLNYAWSEDRDGNLLDGKPIDAYNHAIDAARYAIYSHTLAPKRIGTTARTTRVRKMHRR